MTTITVDSSERTPRGTDRLRALTPRSQLQVELFGRFRARPETLQALESGKAQELLCYLLVHRHRPQSREQLATVLWPDGSPERTKKYLRQALWQLQAALDVTAPEGRRLITSDGAWVQLSPTARIEMDVAAFEETYARWRRMAGPDLEPCTAVEIDGAVQLYQGDLLEGWYQDWCLYERERLQGMYLTMLDKLMLYSMAHGYYEAGLAYGQRSLRHDRARERTHRQLMQLHHLAGERVAAVRQFQTCHDILQEELGVQPSQRTVVLYDQIRLEQPDGVPSVLPGSETVADLLARLRQLRSALADIERQVSRDIQSIECVLSRPARAEPDRARRGPGGSCPTGTGT